MTLNFNPQVCLSALDSAATQLRAIRESRGDSPRVPDTALGRGFSAYAARFNELLRNVNTARGAHAEAFYGNIRHAEENIKSLIAADEGFAQGLR